MPEIYRTGTEYLANTLTITRGSVEDITAVGVYHSEDPNAVPEVNDFTIVTLVDGTSDTPDPLSTPGLVEVLSLIGPKNGDIVLTAGDYQRFVLVQTATEDIIRKIDTVTIL